MIYNLVNNLIKLIILKGANNLKLKKILLCGFTCSFIAYIIFVIIQRILNATDVQGFILISTIILSGFISASTYYIVENLKK